MRVALVGLAASEVLIIKNYLKKYTEHVEITWTSVTKKDYDVLIVRARFLETPEIERLVLEAGDDVVVLAVYRDDAFGTEAINRNIPSLKVPSYDKEDIIEWVSHIRKDRAKEQIVKPTSKHTSSKHISEETAKERQAAINKGLAKLSATGAKLTSSSDTNADAKSVESNSAANATANAAQGFINQDLLKAIKEDKDLIVTAGAHKTWIKTDQRRVFTNYTLNLIPSFGQVEWESYTFTKLPEDAKYQVELNQWLWESMWKSDINFAKFVDDNSSYQLKRWPQPKSKTHRNEPLRIAAHIQKKAITVKDICQLTDIDEDIIRKFLYTMQVVGFVKKTKVDLTASQATLTKSTEEKDESKLTLLKRLRSRLGLKEV